MLKWHFQINPVIPVLLHHVAVANLKLWAQIPSYILITHIGPSFHWLFPVIPAWYLWPAMWSHVSFVLSTQPKWVWWVSLYFLVTILFGCKILGIFANFSRQKFKCSVRNKCFQAIVTLISSLTKNRWHLLEGHKMFQGIIRPQEGLEWEEMKGVSLSRFIVSRVFYLN